jgi:SAM-dependent methyltransferase
MALRERWRRYLPYLLAAAVCLIAPATHAQFPYDVPYVPTPPVVVEEMLRLANVGPDDFVVDLGSGDGRILIAAARKFGARGVGVDLDPDRIEESVYNAQLQGVSERVAFQRQDLFKFDISQATVLTMYLLPSVNMKLRSRLLRELKAGTRIVSHDFDMEDWQPDQKSTVRKNVFLWIVPAQAGGRWRTTVALPAGSRGYDIEIRQKFQEIDGLARYEKKVAGLWNPVLRGDRISFVIVDDSGPVDSNLYFEGRVTGDSMEGTIRRGVGKDETRIPWRASRVAAVQ